MKYPNDMHKNKARQAFFFAVTGFRCLSQHKQKLQYLFLQHIALKFHHPLFSQWMISPIYLYQHVRKHFYIHSHLRCQTYIVSFLYRNLKINLHNL